MINLILQQSIERFFKWLKELDSIKVENPTHAVSINKNYILVKRNFDNSTLLLKLFNGKINYVIFQQNNIMASISFADLAQGKRREHNLLFDYLLYWVQLLSDEAEMAAKGNKLLVD